MEYITLEPNWEETARFVAEVYIQQGYEKNSAVGMINLIEQIRYLTQTDIDAVQRILDRLERYNG